MEVKNHKRTLHVNVKEHFCRGKKWVFIPSDSVEFEKIINICAIHSLAIEEQFKTLKKAYVRFSNVDTLERVVFTIHENTSVASKLYICVDTLRALSFDQLDGTPKSTGLDNKKAKPVSVKTFAITKVEDHVSEPINALDTETKEKEHMIITSDEPQSIEEWEKFLESEGLTLEADID